MIQAGRSDHRARFLPHPMACIFHPLLASLDQSRLSERSVCYLSANRRMPIFLQVCQHPLVMKRENGTLVQWFEACRFYPLDLSMSRVLYVEVLNRVTYSRGLLAGQSVCLTVITAALFNAQKLRVLYGERSFRTSREQDDDRDISGFTAQNLIRNPGLR